MADTVQEAKAKICSDDLKLFGGAAGVMIILGVISIWVPDFRAVVATNISTLIGAVAMYLKAK
jgi:hypothetical protein